MPNNPLGEVFGFPCSNVSETATRYRRLKFCPFPNRVPSCTKEKADDPLGVCSVVHHGVAAITCPIRFRQDWIIAEDAAAFFFPEGTSWTSLTEVGLNDKNGNSAGNIDVVLVSYDGRGKVTDFGALEVQGVYISGNVRRPFEHYMENPVANVDMDWRKEKNYPRPDYLSSSRKRLVPQLLYKGGILNAWKKKIAVALDEGFFATLPSLKEVDEAKSDIGWLIYKLEYDEGKKLLSLKRSRAVHTIFHESIDRIARPEVGSPDDFIKVLQDKLDDKLEGNSPDNKTIQVERLEGFGAA